MADKPNTVADSGFMSSKAIIDLISKLPAFTEEDMLTVSGGNVVGMFITINTLWDELVDRCKCSSPQVNGHECPAYKPSAAGCQHSRYRAGVENEIHPADVPGVDCDVLIREALEAKLIHVSEGV